MKYYICKNAQDGTCKELYEDQCVFKKPALPPFHKNYCGNYIEQPCDWHGKSMEQIRNKFAELYLESGRDCERADYNRDLFEAERFLTISKLLKFADWLANKENK